MTIPQASLSPLNRADGSSTFSSGGYTVIAAVNGPIEVQRRDELPEEAALEVNVRPASGVGSPKERHTELILHSALRHIILTHLHPRTLVQLTLQILSAPSDASLLPPSTHLPALPALINAATLALVDAGIPLATTLTAALVVCGKDGTVMADPDVKHIVSAGSVHVFAFEAGTGAVVVAESEGAFGLEVWERACEVARGVCGTDGRGVDEMEEDGTVSVREVVGKVVRERVESARAWKAGG